MQVLDKANVEVTQYPQPRVVHNVLRDQDNSRKNSSSKRDIKTITGFTHGTHIATIKGFVLVQDLNVGDRVLTRDRGFQSIRWIGNCHFTQAQIPQNLDALPVKICAHALGHGQPECDIIISPRHRILTTDKTLLTSTNETEALVEASALIGRPGITRVIPNSITYIHVLFDQHEVILSDNLWSESFHLGRAAATTLLKENHKTIRTIFPQIETHPKASPQMLARPCLTHAQVQPAARAKR